MLTPNHQSRVLRFMSLGTSERVTSITTADNEQKGKHKTDTQNANEANVLEPQLSTFTFLNSLLISSDYCQRNE